jgi:hypothetical protein
LIWQIDRDGAIVLVGGLAIREPMWTLTRSDACAAFSRADIDASHRGIYSLADARHELENSAQLRTKLSTQFPA